MSDTEERSICVRENEILTDIYSCKVCCTQVKRDRMDIEAHLKQAHKTTLKVYGANFENPSNQDSLEATVSRLVREGKMEDPAKNTCRTPKKIKPKQPEIKSDFSNEVPENENLNKFISVTEHVPGDKEAEVTIKSENEESITSHESSFGSLVAGNGYDKENRKRKSTNLPSRLRNEISNSDLSKGDLKPLSTQWNHNSNSINIKTDPDGPRAGCGYS